MIVKSDRTHNGLRSLGSGAESVTLNGFGISKIALGQKESALLCGPEPVPTLRNADLASADTVTESAKRVSNCSTVGALQPRYKSRGLLRTFYLLKDSMPC
jgi:hypothetical protein